MPTPLNPTPIANSIGNAIAATLATIPAGGRGSLLLEATTENGVQAVLAARVGNHWQMAAGTGVDLDRHLSGFIATRIVW